MNKFWYNSIQSALFALMAICAMAFGYLISH